MASDHSNEPPEHANRKTPPQEQQQVASDHSLLRRLREGHPDAATDLYLRYAARLQALARSKTSSELAQRVDTEEIVQSVFGSFFRRAQKGIYDVPVGEELWRLLLVIALNKIRSKGAHHNAAKRDVRNTVQSGGFESQDVVPVGDDELAVKILEMTVDESLKGLPDHYQTILSLRIEGYEVQEISERVQRSKRTVERVLQEIRKSLSHLLYEP